MNDRKRSAPAPRTPLHAFEGFGIELEYMIVENPSLDVAPISDQLIHDVAGEYCAEVELGETAWSNELVLHVIELKTNGPAPTLATLPSLFQRDIERINVMLTRYGARLMPGAAHPWMDPLRETRLWPHEYDAIYAAYDRIFGCQGHGWSNLQSVHINLPFANDDEFVRLHAAIRLVLPLLPALAASSPFLDGRATGRLDSRLEAYRHNARRIPSITGLVVPEPVHSQADYHRIVLEPMYAAIAPHDPDGILQHEWLNSRGAIARFDRNAIEIRVLDIQECPQMDLAIAAATVGLVRALYDGRTVDTDTQLAVPTETLAELLLAATDSAEQAHVTDRALLRCLGWDGPPVTLQVLWRHLLSSLIDLPDGEWLHSLWHILDHGPLARRLLAATGPEPDRARLLRVYGALCDCLAQGRAFPAHGSW